MISIFRHHLQSRPLRYTVYAVSFLIMFPYALITLLRFGDSGNWVVSVNGAKADQTEYQQKEIEVQQQIERIKAMFGEKAGDLLATSGLAGDIKDVTLRSLTMQKLLTSIAQRMDIHISRSFSTMFLLRQLPRQFLLPDGTINAAMVEQAYHMSLAQIEEQQEQHIKNDLVVQLADGALYLPQFVLKDYFVREYVNHRFLIVTLPLTRFIEHEKQQVVTAKDLKDFFDAENRRSKRYIVPELRSGLVWTFSPDTYGITITDNQIKRYYERNKHTEYVATPVQLQVRAILLTFNDKTRGDVLVKAQQLHQELLKNPALFEQKAREFSQDSATKNKGGLMDYFARGKHEQRFEQEAFKLAADGAISPAFQTSKGIYILQRVGRKVPTYKSLDSVRAQITHALRVEQFKYSFPNMIRRFAAQEQENKQEALAAFAREHHGQQRVVTKVANDATSAVQKLFAVRLGGIGSFIEGENGVAVLVTGVEKSYEPALEPMKTRVTNDYYRVHAEQALKKVLKKADGLTSAEQLRQFAHEQGARVEETEWINAHAGEQALKKLTQLLGKDLTRFFALTTPGSVAVLLRGDAGYAVCLAGLAPFDQAAFTAHKHEATLALVQEQRGLVQQGFVASLCKTATIKVQDKFRV
jgi:parvulin-like peptidyl-prolyl isomerase